MSGNTPVPEATVTLPAPVIHVFGYLCSELGEPASLCFNCREAIWILYDDPTDDDVPPDMVRLDFGEVGLRVDVMGFCEAAETIIGHCAIQGIPWRGPREMMKEDEASADDEDAGRTLN